MKKEKLTTVIAHKKNFKKEPKVNLTQQQDKKKTKPNPHKKLKEIKSQGLNYKSNILDNKSKNLVNKSKDLNNKSKDSDSKLKNLVRKSEIIETKKSSKGPPRKDDKGEGGHHENKQQKNTPPVNKIQAVNNKKQSEKTTPSTKGKKVKKDPMEFVDVLIASDDPIGGEEDIPDLEEIEIIDKESKEEQDEDLKDFESEDPLLGDSQSSPHPSSEVIPPLTDEDIVLTDAEGRRYCKIKDCDQMATTDGHCRYHYLLLWKKIQVRRKILADGKLERYVEELTSRYPDKFLEMIWKDLRNGKNFLSAITELEIDESGAESDYEDETQSYLEEVRGATEANLSEEEEF